MAIEAIDLQRKNSASLSSEKRPHSTWPCPIIKSLKASSSYLTRMRWNSEPNCINCWLWCLYDLLTNSFHTLQMNISSPQWARRKATRMKSDREVPDEIIRLVEICQHYRKTHTRVRKCKANGGITVEKYRPRLQTGLTSIP